MTTLPFPWRSTVPPGEHGRAVIERFTVSAGSLGALRYALQGRPVTPGEYQRLLVDGVLWMSDTPAEAWDHRTLLLLARERAYSERRPTVLVHGLGLGVAVESLIGIGVASLDVVELDDDVLSLVGPHVQRLADAAGVRLTLHHDNALTKAWPTVRRWDLVWHDIWPTISAVNLDAMTALHRRFGRRCYWQGSWCKDECRRLRGRRG